QPVPRQTEIHRLSNDLAIAQRYDASVKADLFATALATTAGTYLVDPFEMEPAALDELVGGARVAGVVVTNANHERASHDVAARFSVPVYAHPDAGVPAELQIEHGNVIPPDLKAIAIQGAPRGECAIYSPGENGTLIIGDALINFGSHGFTLLPPKYCSDARVMQRSLRRLLDYQFERIVFAHGHPITTAARARLVALLDRS
ncbi:MAG TPA: hypothetical protein VF551_05185, partial [Chthoniobacterales bacterium]